MNKKTIIWVFAAIIVLLIGYRIVASRKPAKVSGADNAAPVYVKKIARGSIQNVIGVSGNIIASQQADIFSRVPGKLISNLVDEGDIVAYNQEIALIDRDEVGVEFTTATVKSSISGILLKRYLDPGSRVNPVSPIAMVGNIDKVKAVVNVSEGDFTKVKKGMKAYIMVDAYPSRKFSGEITLIAPSIDLMSRTGRVEILIDNTGQNLKPGMFASVELLLSYHSGVIVIPRDTIIEDDSMKRAFVVENGKASERALTIGMFDDSKAEVLKGLMDGEILIVAGHRKIKNGDPVRVIQE